MTREIKCNMGRSSFTHKPTSAETGKMVNDRELNNPVRIILEDFVRQLTEEGRTCRINACSGDRDIDFEESWFLTLDHDNGGKSKDGVFVPSS